ncbi:hypothetical protein CYMTET_13816 [Cymbomonas tetramitiformis]|uniref:Uncharacterized protein n=1 Tax=Cymbomonas tetramitiformis TaxID=36881 RepID=A0AAE0GHL4_9CHLO|nr:hypothetical protein CYMTET_13816 [Cymbomonas tetramitiformis]
MPADTGIDAVPAAMPPRKQIRYRQSWQGFERNPMVPQPPAIQDPDPPVPGSPPYSPPPYSSDDKAEASIDTFDIDSSSISSTHDVAEASWLTFGCPMEMLRAGTTLPPPESG